MESVIVAFWRSRPGKGPKAIALGTSEVKECAWLTSGPAWGSGSNHLLGRKAGESSEVFPKLLLGVSWDLVTAHNQRPEYLQKGSETLLSKGLWATGCPKAVSSRKVRESL